jgi:hypothetical protein
MNHHQRPTRISEDTQKILQRLPHLKFSKYISASALNETAKILEKLPRLEFPITSAGDLIEKLGGPDTRFEIGPKQYFARMATRIPVYYFPIASAENLVEKMADLMRSQRPEEVSEKSNL